MIAVLPTWEFREADLARPHAEIANAEGALRRSTRLGGRAGVLDSAQDSWRLRVHFGGAAMRWTDTAHAHLRMRSAIARRAIKVHAPQTACVDEERIAERGRMHPTYAIAEWHETEIERVLIGQWECVGRSALTEQLLRTVNQVGLAVRNTDTLRADRAAKTQARVVEVEECPGRSERAAAFTKLPAEVESIAPCDRGDGKLRSVGPLPRRPTSRENFSPLTADLSVTFGCTRCSSTNPVEQVASERSCEDIADRDCR